MLIIAQPKSASTSLMVTLAKILNVGYEMAGTCKNKSEDFKVLGSCHKCIGQRTKIYFEQLIDGKKVFKDHVIPTKENIDALKEIGKPVVILLRKPDDSYDSYMRQFEENNNTNTDRKELKKELKKFYNEWENTEGKIFLKVYYQDLILHYKSTMIEIINHIVQIPPLEKLRYTGIGVNRLLEKKYNNPKDFVIDKLKEEGIDVIDSTAEECIDEPSQDTSEVDECES